MVCKIENEDVKVKLISYVDSDTTIVNFNLDAVNINRSALADLNKGFISYFDSDLWNHILITTTDGGKSWDNVAFDDNLTNYYGIYDLRATEDGGVFFFSEIQDKGLVLCGSTDSGVSWFCTDTKGDKNVNRMYCFTKNILFKSGVNGIVNVFKSIDSGKNWIETSGAEGTAFSEFDFWDDNRGIGFQKDYGYETNDGGLSWTPIIDFEDPFFPTEFEDVIFFDELRYVAVDSEGYVWIYDKNASGIGIQADSRPLLSPNPASPGETIAVSVPESAGVCRVRLLDGFGRTISEIEEPATNSKLEFRLPKGLASGIYWLRIECGGEIFVEKFVCM